MKKLLNGIEVEMTPEEIDKFNKLQLENGEDKFSAKQELADIEFQMKSLNSDRKNLQDLIELGLEADGDIENLEAITLKLNELANQRKELINTINK